MSMRKRLLACIGQIFTPHKNAELRETTGQTAAREDRVKIYLTGFTAKIFIFVITFIVLISAAFTTFFIMDQHTSMEKALINEGYAYLRLFANSSRLGVISENGTFIEDTLEGLLKHGEIAVASVYTAQGKILIKKGRPAEKILIAAERPDSEELIERIGVLPKSDNNTHAAYEELTQSENAWVR